MLIVAKNAEKEFLKQLNIFVKEEPTMRCLYVGSSKIKQEKQENDDAEQDNWVPEFLSAYEQFIDERMFHVFICGDGDLFIFSKGLTHRRLQQFLTHLTPKLTPASLMGLASLFEVGVDWKKISSLVLAKFEKRAAPHDKQNNKNSYSHDELFNQIDSELISNLGSRRNARETVEILVVEDDLLSQRLVRNTLSTSFPVTLCDMGSKSILQYISKAPDIVFLDIGLPDMDGHDVLEKIFSIDPDAFVVMFSGNGSKENILKALQSGAKGFVGKPFSKDKLIQYINRSPHIMNKKRGRKEDGYTVH